jgi:chromosome segregation ATPase
LAVDAGASAENMEEIRAWAAELERLRASMDVQVKQQEIVIENIRKNNRELNALKEAIKRVKSTTALFTLYTQQIKALDSKIVELEEKLATATDTSKTIMGLFEKKIEELKTVAFEIDDKVLAIDAEKKELAKQLAEAIETIARLQATGTTSVKVNSSAEIADLKAQVAAANAKAAAAEAAAAAAAKRAPDAAECRKLTIDDYTKLQKEAKDINDLLKKIIDFYSLRASSNNIDMIKQIMTRLNISMYRGGRYTPANIHTVNIKTKKNSKKMLRYTVRKRSK